MKEFLEKGRKLLLLGAPLLLGVIGFLAAGETNLLHAVFTAITLYLMDYQDMPPNLWIEIARWTAPLATASGVLLAITALRSRLHSFILYRRGRGVAIYGPEDEKSSILIQLGTEGIDGKDEFVRATRYILLGDETENLAFYNRNQQQMADSMVYLKSRSLPSQASAIPNLRLFCTEENAARLFWKKHCFYDLSRENDHQIQIVLIGFGKLGQELVLSGLQNNLFSTKQRIEYHVFGDDGGFCELHKELREISDPVIFHSEPWYKDLEFMERAEAVIVLEQKDQMALLQELLLAVIRPTVYVFLANQFSGNILGRQGGMTFFDWRAEGQQLDHILSDLMYERAMRINLRYAHLYGNVEENEENKLKEWNALDSFTRYSNISSADYHEMQRRILEKNGLSFDIETLSPAWMEELAELEHIRWCRYHFLNNWKFGVPESGSKDKKKRIHKLLVPYEKLDDAEKEKDRENIRILFSI